MTYTLEAVRDGIRNREGRRVFYLGPEDRLTWQAREYLQDRGIEILPAREARPQVYRLQSGGFMEEKPEHMTHLQGNILVPKDHPRIAFRGAMDTLQGELLLCALQLRDPVPVEEVLDLAGKLLSWEVLEEPVPPFTLGGLDQKALRDRSHRPQDFYGVAHFKPELRHGPAVLWLNRCRCAARAAELAAIRAFQDREGCPTRTDLLEALNRMSSYLYILMIQEVAHGA